jgi:hypothetical protein
MRAAHAINFRWLLTLRWGAIAGQILKEFPRFVAMDLHEDRDEFRRATGKRRIGHRQGIFPKRRGEIEPGLRLLVFFYCIGV